MTRTIGACLWFLLAILAAPAPALGQELVFKLGSSPSQVLVSKTMDMASVHLMQPLVEDIRRSLIAANVGATPADIEAIAQAVAAQASVWQHDFILKKVCDKNATSRGTAPSGAFTYVLECRDCRPRTC